MDLGVETDVNNMDFEGLTSADIHVSGASVKSINIWRQTLEVVLTPIKARKEAELKLAVRCNQQQLPFRVKLDLSKPRKKKGDIPVQLVR